MLHFLQPAATLFIGLALSVYVLIQAFLHAPPVTAFQTAARRCPTPWPCSSLASGSPRSSRGYFC